jgi:hypothetical protein
MMFIEMDGDSSGVVTKDEFINYVRSRPKLQCIFYDALTSVQSGEQRAVVPSSPQHVRAMGHHRIIKVYKSMDANRSGFLQWEELLAFFERTGLLLNYTTSDNPRDRMAAVLANESRRRQTVKKWQRGGAAFGVGQEAKLQHLAEGLHSKFLIDQKEAQVNAQWAAERVAKMQEQSARRTDALSIVADSFEAFKEARQVRGTHGRRFQKAHQELVTATPETMDTEMSSVIDSERSSPTVSSTPVRPCTPEPKMYELQVVADDANCANSMRSGDPVAEEKTWLQWSSLPVPTSGQIVQLPKIQLKPAQRNSKSPMRRKGRLCETSQTKCLSPAKCPSTSPKRSQSKCNVIKAKRSVSPIKRAQTPRW